MDAASATANLIVAVIDPDNSQRFVRSKDIGIANRENGERSYAYTTTMFMMRHVKPLASTIVVAHHCSHLSNEA